MLSVNTCKSPDPKTGKIRDHHWKGSHHESNMATDRYVCQHCDAVGDFDPASGAVVPVKPKA